MFRTTLLALTAAAGIMIAPEIGTQEARADTKIVVVIGSSKPVYPVYPTYPTYPTYPGYPGGVSYYPTPVQPICHHYHVFYRHCYNEPWQLYGTFSSHALAHQVEHQLECKGYQAKVVHH